MSSVDRLLSTMSVRVFQGRLSPIISALARSPGASTRMLKPLQHFSEQPHSLKLVRLDTRSKINSGRWRLGSIRPSDISSTVYLAARVQADQLQGVRLLRSEEHTSELHSRP